MAVFGTPCSRHVLALPVLLAVLTASLGAQQHLQLFLSFADREGEPITDITETQLRILEDGVEGRITSFEPIDWPVRVQVLIDNGLGMGRENLLHIRAGVRGFFEMLPAGVEATLLTLAPQPRTVVGPTSDRLALLRGVDLIVPAQDAPRLIDGLVEATRRIERERSERERGDHFPVIVVVGSSGPEGSSPRDRDLQRMMQQLQQTASTVHVVLVTTGVRSLTEVSGARQAQVSAAAADVTQGRYEAIAAPSRLATLLPEIAGQVARSHARQSQQYLVGFERPAGASGDLGHLELEAGIPGASVHGSVDGRVF